MAVAVGNDPYLENLGGLGFHVVFGVLDAGARAHDLYIPRFCPALVAQIVFMGDCTTSDIGDDFHVPMTMGREPALGRNGVIIPDPQWSDIHAVGVHVFGEAEMMFRIEPAMIGMAKGVEGANFNHAAAFSLVRSFGASKSITGPRGTIRIGLMLSWLA